jgi:hypothetical protein
VSGFSDEKLIKQETLSPMDCATLDYKTAVLETKCVNKGLVEGDRVSCFINFSSENPDTSNVFSCVEIGDGCLNEGSSCLIEGSSTV